MTDTYTWHLAADLSAPTQARARIAEAVGPRAFLDDALLVVSELVTNAVTHGRAPISLTAEVDEHQVRLAVVDAGSGYSSLPNSPDSLASSGRGLQIVESLSRESGAHPTDQGWESWAVVGVSAVN